ncbi:methylamine utilization protein [Agarivorans sp. Toyoura001]|uniref:methylamine utilization protein n=1 Tax=unclassified Agarivorans TaxID=2636026 RepID=UPI0010D22092|nr:methylamine utilization protein [Agarivorans sp. Toyoura001]GDY25040.1 hypothetical protein AHAT_09300 [Agarivorans sp. Toyoura001]
MSKYCFTLLVVFPCMLSQAAETLDYAVQVNSPDNNPVQDVVVYLTPIGHQLPHINQTAVTIGQRDKAFVPYISVAQRGSKVDFNNDDNITHHIYSAVGENKFSFQIKAGEQHSKSDFNHSGVVPMGCNIHDWMGAYLLLVDTPLFNKTDSQGRANFEQVSAGDYQLTVWHPELKTADKQISQTISIHQTGTHALNLPHALEAEFEQQNPDDFDFLSDY